MEDCRANCFHGLQDYVATDAIESVTKVNLREQVIFRSLVVPYRSLHQMHDCFGPPGDADPELSRLKVCRDVIAKQLEGHFAGKAGAV